ncbi:MAG: YqeG family HAD IIIA-type phosphatase [Armatimonadota bacterium]|nr:YqeG family HAD IIIA-type phosphatase [Armatimonadota bacterium]MDR7538897.1 YqeG family HAD IIIA-type phosphatase [Armatimonadota bacterium]
MRLRDLLRPRLWLPSITDVDVTCLRVRGIRGIVLDLDNTLVPYGAADPPAEVCAWVARAQAAGFPMVLVTNNRSPRSRALAERLGLPIAPGWAKPASSMFRRAMEMMGTTPHQTALVGDQLLTDILGGNRLGLFTILVEPLGRRDFPATRWINRTVERMVLRLLRLSGPPRSPRSP